MIFLVTLVSCYHCDFGLIIEDFVRTPVSSLLSLASKQSLP